MYLLYAFLLAVLASEPSMALNNKRTAHYGPNSSLQRQLIGGVRPATVLTVDYPEIVTVNVSVKTGKSFALHYYSHDT